MSAALSAAFSRCSSRFSCWSWAMIPFFLTRARFAESRLRRRMCSALIEICSSVRPEMLHPDFMTTSMSAASPRETPAMSSVPRFSRNTSDEEHDVASEHAVPGGGTAAAPGGSSGGLARSHGSTTGATARRRGATRRRRGATPRRGRAPRRSHPCRPDASGVMPPRV
jgi:hypothetical protein